MAEDDDNDDANRTQYLDALKNGRRTFMKLAGGSAGVASGLGAGAAISTPVSAQKTDYCFQVDLVQNEAANILDPVDGNNKYNDVGRLISWQWGNNRYQDDPQNYVGEDQDNFSYIGECTVDSVSDISFDFANETASVEVSVSNCNASSIDLALVTYAAPCGSATNPGFTGSTQNLFATTQQTVNEGNNATLTVDIPSPAPEFLTDRGTDDGVYARMFSKPSYLAFQIQAGGNAAFKHTTQNTGLINTSINWSNYNDGVFHHMAAVFDSSSGLEVYIDGTQVASDDTEEKLKISGSQPWCLGANGGAPTIGEPFEGQLDDFAVYDRALSASEVSTLSGGGSVTSGLVSKWDFEDKVYSRYRDTVGDNTMFLGTGSSEPSEVSGRSGTVLDFDGTDDFAIRSDTASLDLADQITLSLFFRSTQAPSF
jgi:hypothetical protein